MTNSKKYLFAVSDEIRKAIEQYCDENGIDKSDLFRDAILEKIGHPELAETMRKRGKPAKKKSKRKKKGK